MIRVEVADDEAIVREGIRLILDSQPDIQVIAQAGTGMEAVELGLVSKPDVVIMDIRMPGIDGIEATKTLLAQADWLVKIIIVTTFALDEYVYRALRCGASGFILKGAPPRQLPIAVREVFAGETMLSSEVTRRLIEQFSPQTALGLRDSAGSSRLPVSFSTLTAREIDVLRLIAGGLANQDIAARLVVSTPTVKTHVASILSKMGVHDRTQAAIAAYEHGLVVPSGRRLPY
jgi:DNA-binding NarL/FixJ family response regulator